MHYSAFIEADVDENRVVWNLITLSVDEDGKEVTEVTSFATKQQAKEAKEAFLG
jgi:hypothetical protein